MIRQCAWCLKILGTVPPHTDTRTTHTICKKCEKKVKEELMKRIGIH